MAAPHESSHLSFQELVQLARADRVIRGPERRMLDRFARHLGIPEEKARRYFRACRRTTREFPSDPQRQVDLLRMLARVAYSDGVLQDAEMAFFKRLSAEFAIPRTRLARILEEAESGAHRDRHLDRRWICAGVLSVALIACGIWFWSVWQPDEMTGFKALDTSVRASLVLVHTTYVLEHDQHAPRRGSATGTGFFVSEDGLLVTNKHIVQPWRFVGSGVKSLAQGYRLRAGSVQTLAWCEGAQVLDRNKKPNAKAAFSTRDETLKLLGCAGDSELPRDKRPKYLREFAGFCHAHDNGDLALFQASVRQPVVPLALSDSSAESRRLDPVMVLGYPRGLHLLESDAAVSSPSIGRVRKAEDTIYVSAPIVGGNSGGPLLDRYGRVIGVATRTSGDATMACCLRVEHCHKLIAAATR